MFMMVVGGCGESSSPDPTTPTATPRVPDIGLVDETADPEETAAPTPAAVAVCREPSGQEKASLRFAVRSHDRELRDEPWALVRRGGVNWMAAEIDSSGPRAVVLVRFSSSGQYLAGMRAVNGTARTFTDLPNAGDRIPAAGQRALDCLDS